MRITLENFKDHVTPFQLRKGQDYFNRGRVSNLQRSATGRWTAIVKGREPYKVRFDTHGGEISEVFCDCIAQADNTYCKHVLAMLLAIEAAGGAAASAGKLAPIRTYEEETELMVQTVRAEMEAGQFQPAANRVLAMIKSMPSVTEQENEDVEDMIFDRVKAGFKLMVGLARSAAPQELKDRMYKRSLETALDRRWTPWHCDPHWMEVLVILGSGKEEEILGIVDRLLELETDYHRGFDHYVHRFLSHKIDLLRALGREEQAVRLLETNPLSRLLRERLIREFESAGNFGMIKALCEHGIETAVRIDPHLHDHWQVVLVGMAVKFKDAGTIREYAGKLYRTKYDIKYYRLIKDTYGPVDWRARLEADFIKPLAETPTHLSAILAEEKDWPRLVDLLQRRPVFSLVQKYTDVLLPHYPGELLGLYRQGLIEYATDNKHAEAIAEVVSTMRKMAAWPGGRKAVKALAGEFQRVFASRKKLLEAVERFL